jgi:predicted RNA-binding Zn ribbon-like protein
MPGCGAGVVFHVEATSRVFEHKHGSRQCHTALRANPSSRSSRLSRTLTAKVPIAGETPSTSQPGGRAPAPGALGLVQAFINSFYDLEFEHGADLFATPASLSAWLSRSGLPTPGRLREADVRRAVTVREGLRALARGNGDGACRPDRDNLDRVIDARDRVNHAVDRLNDAARGATVEVRFTQAGPRFVAGGVSGLDRALGMVFASTAESMIAGSWSRLKICPGEHCGWAFYDHSRNLSGRWCSMAVCGGRAKARTHYRRQRERGR